MAWIELHQSVWSNKKTLHLAARLGISKVYAAAHMAHLWCWALDNAQEGDLTEFIPAVIADAAAWPGNPDQFVEAMKSSRYLVEINDKMMLCNWMDYAGKLIEKRKQDAERKRMTRERPADIQRTSSGHPCDGARNRNPNHNQVYITTPLPPPETKTKPKPLLPGGQATLFEQFWQAYPRKKSKGAAEKAWTKIKPDEQLHNRIMSALESAKTSEDWTRQDEKRFIPYPASWLNDRGWEDEYIAGPTNSRTEIDLVEAYHEERKRAAAKQLGSGASPPGQHPD